jgi:predicted dehydrogenase
MLKVAGGVAAAAAVASWTAPFVHAADNNTIQIALVGCGGRGTGAAVDALRVKNGPIKLVAMADVFKDRLDSSFASLNKGEFKNQIDVPQDRMYTGFDSYKNAMDALKPGDIVILTTPPAFRWVHFGYAIQKGLNVFMEKPTTVDGPSTKKMLKLAEDADKKNLKVGVGLMCRHCDARGELFKRIKDGQIGDLMLLRAARMKGPEASCFSPVQPKSRKDLEALVAKGMFRRDLNFLDLGAEKWTELEYQMRQFHSFLWLSGGCYSDFLIHNIDECCWMKDAWPVKALATGGRHYRVMNGVEQIDQNFDHYSVEYTFDDGARLLLEGRTMPDCDQDFSSLAYGTKGSCVISQSGHAPSKARTYKGWNFAKDDQTWAFDKEEPSPYQLEWNHLIEAIRNDKPYNEAHRGAKASLVTSMGRMSAHTGRAVTYDQILNSDHEFAPNVDKLTLESPAPLVADKEGRYPVPTPGKVTKKEYEAKS